MPRSLLAGTISGAWLSLRKPSKRRTGCAYFAELASWSCLYRRNSGSTTQLPNFPRTPRLASGYLTICHSVSGAWWHRFLPESASALARIDPPLLSKTDPGILIRSEEHTSELQSLRHLVCRLLLE